MTIGPKYLTRFVFLLITFFLMCLPFIFHEWAIILSYTNSAGSDQTALAFPLYIFKRQLHENKI